MCSVEKLEPNNSLGGKYKRVLSTTKFTPPLLALGEVCFQLGVGLILRLPTREPARA